MFQASFFVTALALQWASIALTAPTNNEVEPILEPRCGIFLAPESIYLLKEDAPNTFFPITDYTFQTFQKDSSTSGGIATGRQYTLVQFPPTPSGSYGCQLQWNIPANTQFLQYYGNHQLDIKFTNAYNAPFRPTWNSIIPSLDGVFGSVNVAQGTSSLVNTAQCINSPIGHGLLFVFKFADWIEKSGKAAGASFKYGFTGPAGVFKGPYLNYNC